MGNVSDENIRVRAYYIWEASGRPENADVYCWLKACEELLGPAKKACAKKACTKTAAKTAPKTTAKTPAKPAAKAPTKTATKTAKVEAKSAKTGTKPAAKKKVPAAATVPFYGVKK